MNSRKPLSLATLGAALALVIVIAVPLVARADDEVKLAAALVPAPSDPGAFGEARFESRADRARLEVRFEAITSTTAVYAWAGGHFINRLITLDDQGRGELRLDTQVGDEVPALQEGDVVLVLNAATFDWILFGVLEED